MNQSAEPADHLIGTGAFVDSSAIGTYRPLDDAVRHAASITVCARAHNLADARELLLTLGLIPDPTGQPDPPIDHDPTDA